MHKKILLTRLPEDAFENIKALKDLGYEADNFPIMELEILPSDLPKKIDSFAISSKNSLKSLEHAGVNYKDATLFVVGRQTAIYAAKLGYKKIISGSNDVRSMEKEIIKNHDKQKEILYLTGTETSYDLAASLKIKGYKIKECKIYNIKFTDRLPAVLGQKIDQYDTILCFSKLNALHFIQLIKQENLQDRLDNMRIICLSGRIAQALEGLNSEICYAKKSDVNNMYKLIK